MTRLKVVLVTDLLRAQLGVARSFLSFGSLKERSLLCLATKTQAELMGWM